MSREEADRALERLLAEQEAVEASLYALQDHAGRRLLEGARLTGVTADLWARAERTVTALWTAFETCTRTLRQARELRSRRRWPTREDLTLLTELLRGAVPVPEAGLPAGAAGEGPDGQERLTLFELVERMHAWCGQVLGVAVAADAVWSALPARIDMLSAELRRVRALARSCGVHPGQHPAADALEGTAEELTALRDEVITDPLAFWTPAEGGSPGSGRPDTTRYDRAALALEEARRETDTVLRLRQDSEERLLRVRDVLSRADRTLAEAREARGEVLAKIAASEVPAVSGPPAALHEQLVTAAEYRRKAQWHQLSPLLDRLELRAGEELERAREELSAVTAPLTVRAELRGRLDACRERLAQYGMESDPLLAERYDAARRMLWSAPCNLRAAEEAVLRYRRAAQEALVLEQSGPRPEDGPEPGSGVGQEDGRAV